MKQFLFMVDLLRLMYRLYYEVHTRFHVFRRLLYPTIYTQKSQYTFICLKSNNSYDQVSTYYNLT